MKRLIDLLFAGSILLAASPLLLLVMLLVCLQDFHSPFYIASRVGMGGKSFRMVKMRSMVIRADNSGLASTSSTDTRITPIGRFIRRFKIDEVTQLWNVIRGEMSLVGPRPQVQQDVDLYTEVERRLLAVRPGITDFSSIVFADEGDILAEYPDPDLAYQQIIRPWKSRLGLFYVDRPSLITDLKLVVFTIVNVISRRRAHEAVAILLKQLGASDQLVNVARRIEKLQAFPPPGASHVYQKVRDDNTSSASAESKVENPSPARSTAVQE